MSSVATRSRAACRASIRGNADANRGWPSGSRQNTAALTERKRGGRKREAVVEGGQEEEAMGSAGKGKSVTSERPRPCAECGRVARVWSLDAPELGQ